MTKDWNPRDLPGLTFWFDPSDMKPGEVPNTVKPTKSYSRLRRWWRRQHRKNIPLKQSETEVLLFDRALSDAERDAVDRYLSDKRGSTTAWNDRSGKWDDIVEPKQEGINHREEQS